MNFLQQLREKAEKATDGPWEYCDVLGRCWVWTKDKSGYVYIKNDPKKEEHNTAKYIAIANPQTILAMLKVIDAGEKLSDEVFGWDLEINSDVLQRAKNWREARQKLENLLDSDR